MNFLRLGIVALGLFFIVLTGSARAIVAEDGGRSFLEERRGALVRQDVLLEREKELAAELLAWDVKIEAARQEQDGIRREIPVRESSLARAEAGLAESAARYEEGMEWLGRWVNFLYRYGPATYLEVVLNAASFNDFVERAEAVRIAVATQVGMLDEVRETAKKMHEQVLACRRARDELAAKNSELAVAIKEMEELREGRREFLDGVRRESAETAARIVQAETSWYRSVTSLRRLISRFKSLPWGALSPEDVSFSGGGLLVAFSDSEINGKFFEGDEDFAGLSLRSAPGLLTLSGPAAAGGPEFELGGNFVVEGGSEVRFQPRSMTLAGVPVSREVMDYISSDSAMKVDIGSISRGFRLSEVRPEAGRLILLLERD
ncbi:MAG TPA: hypothetical protein PK728_11210 [Bacillota bacterium]|nr:hypothetical protein [Bacillota bacterium]